MQRRLLQAAYEGVGIAGQRLGLHEWRGPRYDAVMMYHSVREPARVREHTSDITVGTFREHLRYFTEHFEVVDLPEVVGRTQNKRIALTFDDGYRDFYTNVRPVLHEFDVPATVFVITEFLDDPDPRTQVMNTGHLFETLTTAQVRELADDPLVTVGNHTRTHHNLGAHDRRDIIEDEVHGAKAALEARTGVSPDRFSYPNGACNGTSVAAVRDSHAVATLDESCRPVLPDEDPALLPRVDGGLPFDRIKWRLSDANAELLARAGVAAQDR